MWKGFSLRIRIYLILLALIFVTVSGGLAMVWYTYRMEGLISQIIEKEIAAFQSAAELEAALINQKGFVSYFFQDGDPEWLKRLGEYRQIFKDRLNQSHNHIETKELTDVIDQIENEYAFYINAKDRVIEYYKSGEREEGFKLHKIVRQHFFKILELCEIFKNIHINKILDLKVRSMDEAMKLRFFAGVGMFTAFFLGMLLAFILVNHILSPLRELATEANRENSFRSGNEIKALSQTVRGLIEDVDQTHSELEKSREHLLQAEKMAVVGKLASSMAHSIRNPFTSIKMRLFSLHRTLLLTETQKEDFDVISEEMRHVDNIVQNFLEFARPPRLKIQPVSPSTVVDMAIQLLEQRVKSYYVNIMVIRRSLLPEIQGDPEQLKEVLVNIIINACEAMENGGEIVIREEVTEINPSTWHAAIHISDNGPGIPEAVISKVFDPFFTTKDEGTGLGLSIASRIIEEHHGILKVSSTEGQGSTFTITLPIK